MLQFSLKQFKVRSRSILYYSMLLLSLYIGFLVAYVITTMWMLPKRTEEVVVLVPLKSTTAEISQLLYKQGIINDTRPFIWYARAADILFKKYLIAGEYTIPQEMRPYAVLHLLWSGKVMPRYVTIPEGLTVKQIKAVLANTYGLLDAVGLQSYPEGSVLPDTYQYVYGAEQKSVLERMHDAMECFLRSEWEKRVPNQLLASPEQALILASIVEKEARVPSERARIAALYLHRLEIGMRLQADPTILYEVSGGTNELTRGLTYKDLAKDSPFNTYTRKGLPPTPIANPGREAIRAVLQSKPSKELYFVADGTGAHHFATTYAEHLKNVRHYRSVQRRK